MRSIVRKTSTRTAKGGGDPSIRLYLNEVSKIPLLTPEEEKELGRRIRQGDLIAQQKMIESNLRFVIKVARKFVRRPDQLMEFINVGNVGLIEAARRFDPEMNVRFTSYAIWWIRQAIFHYLSQSTYAFRVSPRLTNILYRTGRVLDSASKAGRLEVPNREQLAKEVGVSPAELNAALQATASPVSLDQPIDESSDIRLIDSLEQTGVPSPEEQAMVGSLRRSLDRTIQHLNPTEQKVIRMRFGFNDEPALTLQEVGQKLHKSRERIRQIERDALKKLKAMNARKAISDYLN